MKHLKYTTGGGGSSSRATLRKKAPSKRRPALIAAVLAAVVALSALIGLGARGVAQAADTATYEVDANTTNEWRNHTNPGGVVSTQNVGRIWTDKSVFKTNYTFDEGDLSGTDPIQMDGSDFLVGLSALSSFSNVATTTTSTKPLDIVLVLDVSGSMDWLLPVYDDGSLDKSQTYHTADGSGNGNGYEVEWNEGQQEWGYYTWSWNGRREWHPVTPTTSANDNSGQYTQLYGESKLSALKDAVNNFIDATAEKNTETVQHRIAIVTFANGSFIRSDFTTNYEVLHNIVDGLDAGGATEAASGMSSAEIVMNGDGETGWGHQYDGARAGALKTLVFFTDGQPGQNGFENGEAGSAIDTAKELKDTGTTIYSVGVFGDADPSDTENNFNGYMNAVSSNYPNATCEGGYWQPSWGGGYWVTTHSYADLNLGTRAPADEDYYFAATDRDGLNQVFEDIASTITDKTGSGSPIEEVTSQEGAQNTPGVLTFTDTLGSYMEVSGDEMTLVFANHRFTLTPNEDGTEWTFEGNTVVEGGVNPAYPTDADVSDITVEVTKGSTAAGDVVTVTIPANLIPMRNYSVNTNADTMTVTDAYPIRLFYGVSLKDDAKQALANPQDANYAEIVASQTSEDQKTIDFYSNSFSKDLNADNGSTTATFTPSEGNRFYYYTADTPLYIDQDCSIPATDSNRGHWGSELYYADPYWQQGDGDEAIEVTDGYGTVSVGGTEWGKAVKNRRGEYYIPVHTQRTDRPATLNSRKDDTALTETANNVLSPAWAQDGTGVVQYLGNNGKITYPAPGSLQISKTVDWGNASDETKTEKNSFTFTVKLTDASNAPLAGTYTYTVTGEGATEPKGTIANDGTITLAHGQTATITGLPNGAKYTVTETQASGFTVTDNSVDSSTTDGVVEGSIASGATATATFANTYHASSVSLDDAGQTISVQKVLENRSWRDTDEFMFRLTGATLSAPSEITITDQNADHTKAFAPLTFDRPGTYEFQITEINDRTSDYEPIVGIDYSEATFKVTVQVEDDGAGKLFIPEDGVTIEQTRADRDGAELDGVNGTTVTFTNIYDADSANVVIDGTKLYTDTTGGNPISLDKFSFQLEAVGGYETNNPTNTVAAEDVPMPASAGEGLTATTNLDTLDGTNKGAFQFDGITFTGDNVGYTYTYRVTELPGSEWGMTYNTEGKSYELTIEVTEDADHVVATPSLNPEDIVFNNVYDPNDATITDDAGTSIRGTKVLQGRQMNKGEKFYFTLDRTSAPAGAEPFTKQTVSVDDSSDMTFSFGDMSFSKTGNYVFTIAETDENGGALTDDNGLAYSKNTCTVTVHVSDPGTGTLTAEVTYANSDSEDTSQALFTNVYTATMDYGEAAGFNVTKTLSGRTAPNRAFSFTLAGEGPKGDIAKNFSSGAITTPGGTATMTPLAAGDLVFTQDDAGKTYTFTVSENIPEDPEDKVVGVTYDQTTYEVAITVVDDGQGSLHTLTSVTKVKDFYGDVVNEEIVQDHSSANGPIDALAFNNTYVPTSATLPAGALTVAKTVTGAPTTADFSFTAQLNDLGMLDAITGLDGDGKMTASISEDFADGDRKTANFGELTFSKAGTYVFSVTEDQAQPDAAEAPAGWTYDSGSRIIRVVVSPLNEDGEYDGQLHASIAFNNAKFTNSYDHGTVTIGGSADQALQVKKVVTGHSTTSDFHFTLAPDESSEVDWSSVKAAEDAGEASVTGGFADDKLGEQGAKTATFGEFTFTEPGIYKFNVTEDEAGAAAPGGWTYDSETKTITVTVTEQNPETGAYDGQLHASIDAVPTFTNSYEASSDSITGSDANFNGTKVLDGRQWLEGEAFGFTMVPDTSNPDVDWGSVSYKANDEADAEPVTSGSSWGSTATANGNDNVAFWFPGTFTFNKAGTYTFNVTETSHNGGDITPGANGMTYDDHTGVITVTVTDDGQGHLEATATPGTVTEGDNQNDMTFTNYYAAEPVTYGDDVNEILGGEKSINDTTGGTYQLQENTFDFIMRRMDDGNPLPADLDVIEDPEGDYVTVKNAVDNGHGYDFGQITFTHDDMTGATDNGNGTRTKAFEYNIFESDAAGLSGISYSNVAYRVTFTVTENLKTGKMTVVPSARTLGDNPADVDMDALDFENTYDPALIQGHQNIFKTIQGRNWLADDEFTFNVSMIATELDESEWTGGKEQLPTVSKSKEYDYELSGVTTNDDGNGFSYSVTIKPTDTTQSTYRFDTGTISYEREGIYTYTVSEAKSTVAGVTEDQRVYTVKVTVTDDGGVLKRAVEISPKPTENPDTTGTGTLGFTNTYVPNDVTTGNDATTGITVQKTLANRAWEDGDAFTFQIAPGEGNDDGPMPAETTITVSGDAGTTAAATKTFGSMTFTKAMLGDAMSRDFAYTVTETSQSEDGVTVDSSAVRNVTVTVTDDGSGQLKIKSITYDNATSASADADKQVTNAAAFTNTYEAKETDGSVAYTGTLTKVLTGHEWTDGFATFDFQISKVSGTLADGTQLNAEQIPDFEKQETSVSQKEGTNEGGNDYATFDFGKVTFTQAGTYVYEVSEVVPTADDESYNPGIDYSNAKATITVTVTDKKADGTSSGQLVATAEIANGTFTNSYETGTVDVDTAGGLQIVKNMTGRAIDAGDFTFTVTSDDPAALAKLPEGKAIEAPVAASTSFSDNKASSTTTVTTGLSFSLADAGKSYTYTVSEQNGGNVIDGVTYDGATHTVRYEVLDGGNGTLTVNAYVDGATEPAATYTAARTRAAAVPVVVTFDNSYDAGSTTVGGDDAAVTINATKALANHPLEDGMFTFDVTNAADTSEQPAVLLSGSNVGDKVNFNGAIEYTTETLNNDVQTGLATRVEDPETGAATYTYTYNVSERAVEGVTQNKGSFTITVKVVDDAKGNLSASVVYPDGTTTGSLGFENTYGQTASQTVSLSGTKVLSAAQGLNAPNIDGQYTFTVTGADESGAALPAELMPERTSATNQNGTVDFGSVTYTMANVFGETGDQLAEDGVDAMSLAPRERVFTYTVVESAGSVAGVTNDTSVKTVTVTVTDNGDGTISVKKSTEGQPTDFTFTNTYSVTTTTTSLTGEGGFTITKKLTSNTGRTPAEGEFAFQLRSVATGEVVAEATNAADGTVTMPAVTFSAPGTYSYELAEVAGDAAGMTYDKATYDVTATVTDNGAGALSVAWSMPGLEGKDVTFTNAYEADPTSVSIVAGKTISGRPLVEGEFTFQMTDAATGEVVAEAANDANGQVAFAPLTYDEVGEHDYKISEVAGTASGVAYDDATYTVHVSVTDDPASGALSAKVTYPDGTPVFENAYTATGSTSITFGATKVLEGRDLAAGEFTFELVGPDGELVATANNQADGSVVFETPVTFNAAGTYTYQVREALPEDDDPNTEGVQKDGVTYDEKVWTATVTVTDDYEGGLAASVSYGDGENLPSFVNTYVAPPTIPDTGDHTSSVLPAILAVGGVALVAGSVVRARRRSR